MIDKKFEKGDQIKKTWLKEKKKKSEIKKIWRGDWGRIELDTPLI